MPDIINVLKRSIFVNGYNSVLSVVIKSTIPVDEFLNLLR